MTKHENTLNKSTINAGKGQQTDHNPVTGPIAGNRRLEDFARTIRGYAIRTAAPPGSLCLTARRQRTVLHEAKANPRSSNIKSERKTMQTNQQHTQHHHPVKANRMNKSLNRPFPATRNRGLKRAGVSALALVTALASVQPAWTAIENSAVAVGTFLVPDDTSSPPATESVPVIPAARDLSIVKSVSTGPTVANGVDLINTDALDTITYLYIITNDGNVTETNITPVDTGPTFNGTAPVNALGAFAEIAGGSGTAASLAPGATVHFEATYTFATLDVLRAAGVTNEVRMTIPILTHRPRPRRYRRHRV